MLDQVTCFTDIKRGLVNAYELTGVIKTFEMTFELTWKTLKDLLEYEGYTESSPRSVIRTALQAGLISFSDCECLLSALNNRNLLTHTDDKQLAEKSLKMIKKEYFSVLESVVETLSRRAS
ncbi:HI0074 family nucleotidyltransferase substrate-binding subunit [Parashewanella tropica]|uniref:HI0074 family nucleotidyltransferase substrate-binding subunit n=1 Tax=Parashewanella tropica TaxID=2547970 RepID=UPI00105A85BB|nr:HI0074 family nucleotidyltransferase substrate-binding subunit [Parashewanella tropica]